MAAPVVLVSRDAPALAAAAAARLLGRVVDLQASRGQADLVLTGGGIGTQVLQAVRDSPARSAVDWRRVNLWWGDERFLPAGDPLRNEVAARQALLDDVDLDPTRVHPMPAADGPDGGDPDAAAARYAGELVAAAAPGHAVPPFDIVLLGMGPEGHVASIFPESPAAYDDRPVLAVHGCPKPPPTRITLGRSALSSGTEVWLLVSGAAKAAMVAAALGGAGPVQVPAAGVTGRRQTLWLLDEAAAAALPLELRRR